MGRPRARILVFAEGLVNVAASARRWLRHVADFGNGGCNLETRCAPAEDGARLCCAPARKNNKDDQNDEAGLRGLEGYGAGDYAAAVGAGYVDGL